MIILIEEKTPEKYTFSFEVNHKQTLEGMYELIKTLKFMGDAGSSRDIKIVNYEHDPLGFDGDGPDKIKDFKINGIDAEKFMENFED